MVLNVQPFHLESPYHYQDKSMVWGWESQEWVHHPYQRQRHPSPHLRHLPPQWVAININTINNVHVHVYVYII